MPLIPDWLFDENHHKVKRFKRPQPQTQEMQQEPQPGPSGCSPQQDSKPHVDGPRRSQRLAEKRKRDISPADDDGNDIEGTQPHKKYVDEDILGMNE